MDLEPHRVTGDKMVGYLRGDYPRANVPAGFLEKLQQMEELCAQHALAGGHHTCEYCFPGGDEELQNAIQSGKVTQEEAQEAMSSGECYLGNYAWPDMLAHYIKVHQYLPPEEFVCFIVESDTSKCSKNNAVVIELPEADF